MHHQIGKIIAKKHFFVKSFIVSLILLILTCLIAHFTYDFWVSMAERMYGLDREEYSKIFVTVMCLWKILIVQFTLVPAIAMMFIEKYAQKHLTDDM